MARKKLWAAVSFAVLGCVASVGCNGMLASLPTDASAEDAAASSADAAPPHQDATAPREDAAAPREASSDTNAPPIKDAGVVEASTWSPDADPSTPDGGCTVDLQCHGGTLCQACNRTCVFPPYGMCDPEAPCPCDYACIQQRCVPNGNVPPAACTFDADCPIDQFCNRALFQCQPPMFLSTATGIVCAKNADCTYGYICSTAGGTPTTCLQNLTVECHTALDCGGPYFCDNGQCRHGGC